ncbi:unnamed protein product [Rangifer tarandus platyrhynchus]|uniref:Uncharacterized protein n=2 Tax=Rangifer tarandus platyrhynchus TaxID=3082113 RepID=A0ACB1KER1_RANTA|nr:unnamed protein product [Rangifer tarandus platyrhynchus]
MEEPAPVEGRSQLPSPHYSSLRKAMAAALVLDGESTMGHRKKKKKESRPESIIIYRSESETLDEEPGESEGGDQPKEEKGEDFLDYPLDDDCCLERVFRLQHGQEESIQSPAGSWVEEMKLGVWGG